MARIARGEEFLDAALQGIANARTIEQLRQAQAVALPLQGMSLEKVSKVIGTSKNWACRLRNRFMQGKFAQDIDKPARGGRRNENFTREQEAKLLEPFLKQASEGGILVVSQIKTELEAALGRSMSLSSVYNLLHRHNWRKLAPDKQHPKSNPEEQAAFKKNFPKRFQSSRKNGRKASPSV